MIESRNPEIDIEALESIVKARILRHRASVVPSLGTDADLRQAFKPIDWAALLKAAELPPPAPGGVGFAPRADGTYRIEELAALNDVAFVRAAYQCILKREPDAAGYQHYLARLRDGDSKVEILGKLRYSPEGRAAGANIKGLRTSLAFVMLCKVPVVGSLVYVGIGLFTLPHTLRRLRILEARIEATEEAARGHALEVRGNVVAMAQSGARILDEVHRALFDQVESRFLRLRVHAEHATDLLARTRSHLSEVEERLLAEELARQKKADQAVVDAAVAALTADFAQRVQAMDAALRVAVADKAPRGYVNESVDALEALLRKEIGTVADRSRQATVDMASRKETRAETEAIRAALGQKAAQEDVAALQDRLANLVARFASGRLGQEGASAWLASEDLDAFYARLEGKFRGSEAEIRERQEYYLPHIRKVGAGSEAAPVVDLGSGRGEWLGLLREAGLKARGVELNGVFVAECRGRGLEIASEDVIEHLRGLPDGSVGAITAFHIIEHLPFTDLMSLIDQSLRVLVPGGVFIAETPNPANLQVGACNFYLDPTHRKPLPGLLACALLELRGFTGVGIEELHPYPKDEWITDGAIRVNASLNRVLYGPQDYAVLGWKAR